MLIPTPLDIRCDAIPSIIMFQASLLLIHTSVLMAQNLRRKMLYLPLEVPHRAAKLRELWEDHRLQHEDAHRARRRTGPTEPLRPDTPEIIGAKSLCARHGNDPANLISILHDVQTQFGFVPEEVLPVIAAAINRSRAEVYGVVSFYHDFRMAPLPGPDVQVCLGEACRALGAAELFDDVQAACGGHARAVYCLGNCALSPAATVGGKLIGRATAERIIMQSSKAAS